jgi:hypothetical protein
MSETIEETGPTGTIEETGPTGTVEETGPTGTTGETGPTGTTGETGPTGTITLLDISSNEPPAPPVIRLDDILADQNLFLQQEARDREKFNVLASPDLGDIRAKLVAWASRGFQTPCDLVVIDITAPNICSDGVQRTFFDYIQFVSGKSIGEHMATLQPILPDFQVAYSYTRTQLRICVVLKA